MTLLEHPRPAAAAPEPAPARRRRLRLAPGWAIGATVAGYPVWWALGLTPVVFPLAALVLVWEMRHLGRRLRVPPGFWLWVLFLAVVLLSGVMLDATAPGTVPPSGSGRFATFTLRLVNYTSVSVFMLYVINRSEFDLPRVRVIRWMALLGVWTVLLGLAGVLFPGASFPTAVTLLLPASVNELLGGTGQATAALAQVQPVLGVAAPRPAAPFAFTNAWGNNLSLLLVWLVALAVVSGRRTRLLVGALAVVSAVPIVYSLNRGMWIGLGLSLLYVAVRLATRGRLVVLGALVLVSVVSAVAFAVSPLQTIVSERLDAGHSNDTRTSLAGDALRAAESSPLLGYGSTRETIGSGASIAIGQSADCPKCGNLNIGSTGQFLLLLIAQGFTGLALYVAYFVRTLWAYRADASPVGIAGTLVLLLTLFYGFFYTGLLMPLAVAFLSIGLLWRNAEARRAAAVASPA